MVKPTESTERATLVARGEELARAYDTDSLIWALRVRLNADGQDDFSNLIMKGEQHEAEGVTAPMDVTAQALIARLRVDGRGKLADAVASLLTEASIDCDPKIRLPEGDGWIAEKNMLVAKMRALGYEKEAERYVSSELFHLRNALEKRLCLDGHRELAEAIEKAWWAFEHRLRRAQGWREPPPRVAQRGELSPDFKALIALGEELKQRYSADVLAYAVLKRLRAEGRESLAGTIMVDWLEEIIGPIADPAQLAAAVIPRLRAEGRGEVADAVASLLDGAAIARDPDELKALWQKEVAGPLIDAGPLGAALMARLRWEKHAAVFAGMGADAALKLDKLADQVATLLTRAGAEADAALRKAV
jgi:hypothetical protein